MILAHSLRPWLLLLTGLALSIRVTQTAEAQVTTTPPDTSMAASIVAVLEAMREADSAAYDTSAAVWILAAQMHLGKLGFGVGPYSGTQDAATIRAARAFERARNLPVTGSVLTVATLARILWEAEELARTERRPSPVPKVFIGDRWEAGYVQIYGTWVQTGAESLFYDVARIECFKSRMQCDILLARLRRPENQLSLDKEVYDIASWNSNEIRSHPLIYPCAHYRLTIDRALRSATSIRETAPGAGCDHMTSVPLVNRIVTLEEALALDNATALTVELFNLGAKARSALQPRRN